MHFRTIMCLLAIISLTGVANRASASLFQDGSFETVSNPYSGNAAIFASAAGWSVNYNGAALGADGYPNILFSGVQGASNGSQAAILDADATNGVGALYQSFTTIAHQTYTLSFDYGQFGYQHYGVSSVLQVSVLAGSSPSSGVQLLNSSVTELASPLKAGQLSVTDSAGIVTIADSAGDFNPEFTPAPNPTFSNFQVMFTSQTTTSTLAFTDLSGNNAPANDGEIDNVQISAVPEPTSFSAVLLSIGALLRRRRR